MPPVSLRTRLQLAGLLPWLLLGPSLFILVCVFLATAVDRVSPWPAARAAIGKHRPSLAICTGISSSREVVRGRLSASHRERSYVLIRPNAAPRLLTVSQDLPNGPVALTEDRLAVAFPLLGLPGTLAGLVVLAHRCRRPSRVCSEGVAPPVVTAFFPKPLTRGPTPPSLSAAALYNAGYFAAWFALLSWFGFFALEFANIPPEGQVSAPSESALVVGLNLFFVLSLLSSWTLSIVLALFLAQRRPSRPSTLVLLAFSGLFWSFAYLFVTLPAIRPGRTGRGA